VGAVEAQLGREPDDEVAHRLGRHQLGMALRLAEARQVDGDQGEVGR
jgi:hypothetical protein